MARIVYAMMTCLDGYIAGPDGDIALPVPEGEPHRHFNDMMRQTSIELCGRRMYEMMRFWDSPDREIGAAEVELDFAHAWRETPKIVFSTTLREVGPNARLMKGDVENVASSLKWKRMAISRRRRRSCGASRTTGLIDDTGSTCTPSCWVAASLFPVRPVADVKTAGHGKAYPGRDPAALRTRRLVAILLFGVLWGAEERLLLRRGNRRAAIRPRRILVDQLGGGAFYPLRRCRAHLGLPGEQSGRFLLVVGEPGLLHEFLTGGLIGGKLKPDDRIGIVVIVAV